MMRRCFCVSVLRRFRLPFSLRQGGTSFNYNTQFRINSKWGKVFWSKQGKRVLKRNCLTEERDKESGRAPDEGSDIYWGSKITEARVSWLGVGGWSIRSWPCNRGNAWPCCGQYTAVGWPRTVCFCPELIGNLLGNFYAFVVGVP